MHTALPEGHLPPGHLSPPPAGQRVGHQIQRQIASTQRPTDTQPLSRDGHSSGGAGADTRSAHGLLRPVHSVLGQGYPREAAACGCSLCCPTPQGAGHHPQLEQGQAEWHPLSMEMVKSDNQPSRCHLPVPCPRSRAVSHPHCRSPSWRGQCEL